MVFASGVFLFLFLPVFLAVYYLTPARFRSLTILIGSGIFYAWWRVDFAVLLFAVMLWAHFVALSIGRAQESGNETHARRWMIAGVVVNLSTLGYFKYWNFGVDTLDAIMIKAGMTPPQDVARVLLPIGISFFVFHAISYIVDIYRRDARPVKHFADFAAFMTLFPQLVAGPVLRFKDLAWQFENREHSLDKFSEGARRFMIGFAKKVLIADTVAPLADAAFALENPSAADAWLGALAYAVQLYFDFSGYSEMAVGLGLMMGFRLIENFNHPYISASITEFWRRWHISLSTWLRDYLYIPLGGNKKGPVRTYVNLFLTMLLGGLWHGANWTFVLWGAWHGIILAIERLLGVRAREGEAIALHKRIARVGFTMLLVLIGWVMFRASDVSSAMTMYGGMVGLNGGGISDAFAWQISGMAAATLALAGIVVYLPPFLAAWRNESVQASLAGRLGVIVLFLLAVTKLLSQSYSPFLYFQF
ncbi:MAG: MBOAT family protein [Rhodospirillales bacterium]|nr:MBOAT family protein [Rhodospirillales bacterium]